jgi:hypothetical protein
MIQKPQHNIIQRARTVTKKIVLRITGLVSARFRLDIVYTSVSQPGFRGHLSRVPRPYSMDTFKLKISIYLFNLGVNNPLKDGRCEN